ncbi:DUF2510 domain-containing protein, partial [Clavibacter michiganensis]|uniref:DUF2510 domain-containing protein n=1 Tax=Clavibacter michiganensis TaxID=28447 RepID=UPI001F5B5410
MSSTPPPVSPTSVTPSSDEPGWFGDGEGNQRFWDGARWTSLVSSRRVFPGRASSTPEPKLISESPLPEDYAPGAAPARPARRIRRRRLGGRRTSRGSARAAHGCARRAARGIPDGPADRCARRP